MENTIFEGFYEKLPVKQRQGRGGVYPYVSADDVTDRMNKLFKGNWTSMVTFQDMVEGQIIIRVRVEATDPETGAVYSHEGFGGHTPSSADEAGNGFKSAYSKALVNAVRRWGVGLFLSDDDRTVSQVRQTNSAPSAPVAPPKAMPQVPKVNIPSAPVAAKEPVVAETATITQALPAVPQAIVDKALPKTPKPATQHDNYLNPPPPPPMPVTPTEVTQAVEKVVAGMPKIPPQATAILTETVAPAPPIPTPTAVTSMVDDDSISDVQKIAIQSLVDMRGFKYEDMAQGALERVPDINTLTHDQAVLVIQFGNNLYRESKQK